MTHIQLDPWQIEFTARHLYPHLWDEKLAGHLTRSPMFTPEQAKESVDRLQQQKIQEVKTCLEAFLKVHDESELGLLNSEEELDRLPARTVVRDKSGDVLEKDPKALGDPTGYWFMPGVDGPFDHYGLSLPVRVLYSPPEESCH